LDVTSQSDVDNAVAETVKDLGSLDVAVNCAGIGTLGLATHEMETEHWRKVLDINLDGVWNCMRAEIKVMRTQQ
jgi:NAD(P)-dependent dehydrogenase (short-subunit alcohol dehydrogenase family)